MTLFLTLQLMVLSYQIATMYVKKKLEIGVIKQIHLKFFSLNFKKNLTNQKERKKKQTI